MYENNYPNSYGTNDANNSASTYQAEAVNQTAAGSTMQGSSAPTGGAMGNNYYYGSQPGPEKAPKEKKSSGGFKKVILGICCGLLFGIFAGIGFVAVTTASETFMEDHKTQTSVSDETLQDSEEQIGETAENVEEVLAQAENTILKANTITDVTEVVKAVMPSVVSVNNKYIETTSFWGQQYTSEAVSTGSGIIVGQNDTELLLVTNYHVVEAAEELTVQFCDGSQAQAQQKGADADKDLAVIAVQLKDIEEATKGEISIATLGDSTRLTVGEPVIAIGNALGYGQSVTTGVVSALNRAIMMETDYESRGFGYIEEEESQGDREINTFIQTDAAINPGNSGGALLNVKGEVIGINSNKIGGSAVEGMGYAIPISDAQPIIEELMKKETRLKVEEDSKGYLGITGLDVVAEYSELYDMPKGVYISSVSEGTGAEKAGLVRGDIITALNGEKVESMDELKEELSYYAAGDTVELTIMQGSPTGFQAKAVAVTLGKVPKTQ